jgi:hypothetical protein
MKRITIVVLNISLTVISVASSGGQRTAPSRAHVVILSTTDMHGRVFP